MYHVPCSSPAAMLDSYTSIQLHGLMLKYLHPTPGLIPHPPLPNPDPRRTQTLAMNKTERAVNTTHNSIREDISQFVNCLTLEETQQRAAALLARHDLADAIRNWDADCQTKFLDKMDEVCRPLPLCRNIWLIASPKIYPTLDRENLEYINALGEVCSQILRLPTSVVFCEGSGKYRHLPGPIGCFRDIWEGGLPGSPTGSLVVVTRDFRGYTLEGLERVEKVSKNFIKRGPLTNKIYRLFGNRYRCGKDCPTKTSCPSVASPTR